MSEGAVALVIRSFEIAGAENMVVNLAVALKRRGADIVAISLLNRRSSLCDRLDAAGIPLILLGKRQGLDLSLPRRLREVFTCYKVSIVHTHLPVLKYTVPAVMGMSKRPKMVHTIHSMAIRETASRVARAFNWICFRSRLVVPVALDEQIQKSIREVYGLGEEQVPVIPNGVDLEQFCGTCERHRANGVVRVLHVGRFMTAKRHATLIEAVAKAVARTDGLQVVLVGDGPLRAEVERQVEGFGLSEKVSFAGLQSTVAGFYQDADIFVLPSEYEGLPMTIIEAMASGLPVIATRVGGIPSLIDDGYNGMLIGKSSDELADALCELAADEELRKLYGGHGLEVSKRFSVERMAVRYERLYRR